MARLSSSSEFHSRLEEVLRSILPSTAKVTVRQDGPELVARVNGMRLRVAWGREGWAKDVRPLLAGNVGRPDVVMARRISPGARQLLEQAHVGWAEETGAAEIAVGTLVVSRTGRPETPKARPTRWTPAVLAVAEALLCGQRPTVKATQEATGLSAGSCTRALQVLRDLELVSPPRGVGPGRGAPSGIDTPSSLLTLRPPNPSGPRSISEWESPGATPSRACDRPVPPGTGRTPNGRRRGPPPPPCSGHTRPW